MGSRDAFLSFPRATCTSFSSLKPLLSICEEDTITPIKQIKKLRLREEKQRLQWQGWGEILTGVQIPEPGYLYSTLTPGCSGGTPPSSHAGADMW